MGKKNISDKIITCLVLVLFSVYAIMLLYPLFWMLINSLKTQNDFTLDTFGLPIKYHFSNWIDGFLFEYKKFNVLTMTLNSLFITVVITVVDLFFNSLCAYVIAKYKFIGRNALFGLITVLMVMPAVGNTVAIYRLLNKLGLYNTHLGLFILQTGGLTGITFLTCFAFFRNLSWSYAEAGLIDGANDFKIYWQIMLPQALPVIFSLAIIQSLNIWNDFFTPYMYLPKFPTLAVGLNELNTNVRYIGNYPLLFSIMIISIIPVLLLFVAFQKKIMDNTMAGGIKG